MIAMLVAMVVVVAALGSQLVASAPVQEQVVAADSQKPLVRTKRAEVVMFGNHQNNDARVKKSDPSVAFSAEEAVIDKKGSMSVENTVPEVQNSPSGTVKELNPPMGSVAVPEVLPEAEEKSPVAADKTEDELATQEELANEVAGPASQLNTELEEDMTSGDIENGDFNSPNGGYKGLPEYYYYDDLYYPYSGMQRRKRNAGQAAASNTRQERSAPKLMTAENMMTGEEDANAAGRVKRDLTADDIRFWLENGGDLSDYPQYEGLDSELYAPEDVQGGDWDDGSLAGLIEQYRSPYVVMDDPAEVDAGEMPMAEYALYPLESEREAEEEREVEETKDRLALLQYLLEDVPAAGGLPQLPQPPAAAVSPLAELYPEDVEETWQDLEPTEQVEYEPILYHGVPGIFIPVPGNGAGAGAGVGAVSQMELEKRQYLSMVPGSRKRAFYPYNAEPASSSRWGALVPGDAEREEKRASDAYERLYRMAQALGGDQNEWRQDPY